MKQDGGARPQRFLRKNAVLERTGLKQSSLYDLMSRGEFPKPVPLGRRAVAWLEDEIERWMQERIAKRDSRAA